MDLQLRLNLEGLRTSVLHALAARNDALEDKVKRMVDEAFSPQVLEAELTRQVNDAVRTELSNFVTRIVRSMFTSPAVAETVVKATLATLHAELNGAAKKKPRRKKPS